MKRCKPADGMIAAAKKGTSARPAGSSITRLHQLREQVEGGVTVVFVAAHESGPGKSRRSPD
jgi:hypothetical protein